MKIVDLAIDSILIGDLAINKILGYNAADLITIGDQAIELSITSEFVMLYVGITYSGITVVRKGLEDGVYIVSVLIFSYIRQYQFIPVNVSVHYVID